MMRISLEWIYKYLKKTQKYAMFSKYRQFSSKEGQRIFPGEQAERKNLMQSKDLCCKSHAATIQAINPKKKNMQERKTHNDTVCRLK